MEIVTGSTGQVHVTPIDDAVRNGNPGYLKDKIIIDYLDKFAATIVSNSYVRVSSGYGMNQGRIFKINSGDYDNVPIENGAQGYKRADLIVARYSMDVQTGFESIELVAIKGSPSSTYVDPSYMTGDINGNIISSDFHDDFPLYRVRINGTTLEGLDRLFTPVPDGGRLGELEAKYENHMKYFNKVNIRTNLSTENAPLLKNGGETGNIRPGVEGTLPVLHGGTGQTTLKAAGDSIIGSLGDNNTAPTDNTVFIGSTPSTSGFQKKTMASLWTYLTGKIRTLLGMGTNNVVPISHGGTGKTSIGNSAILVGSNGAFVEKTLTTNLKDSNDNKIPTTKAVTDALSQAGYGDMMRDTYDPNEDGIIAIANGGTGANTVAGARNALKLGNTDGPVPIANGGTGAASVAAARYNLGLGNTAGALPAANGGTGQISLQATRNAMGLGNTTGALPIANGGTGAATAAAARNALGLGNTTGALPVANGGTGATTAAAARTNLGAMSSGGGTFSGDVTFNGDITMGSNKVIYGNIIDATKLSASNRIDATIGSFTDCYTDGFSLGAAKSTTGNAKFYQSGTSYSVTLNAGTTLTSNRTIKFPNAGGTIGLASSSRRIKENIREMTEERAKKILDVEVVNFDYIGTFAGGLKDQSGVIAEDVKKIIPESVFIDPDYDETQPVDEATNPCPEVDYKVYVPYLIKMVQMQQKEIEELKAALNK